MSCPNCKNNFVIPLKLAFDPKTSNPMIRRIFRDRIARNLWMAWKASHLASQYFNQDCLDAAKSIRRIKPKTARNLMICVVGSSRQFGGAGQGFFDQFLPYSCGKYQIPYIVNEVKV